MKAVPFFEHGSVSVLQYHEDFPDPVITAKDQVIVDVEYCGVNHLDIWARQGTAAAGVPSGKKIRLPHICGSDIVGTVRPAKKKMGSAAFATMGLKEGDRVIVYPGISCGKCSYCKGGHENLCSQFAIIGGLSDYDGGYAEQVVVPARNVVKLPSSLKPEAAATLAVSYLTAWNMLVTNGAGRGKTILVYGAAGGVGMATIQLARALGAKVITTVSSKEKYDFAKRRLGVDHVIDRTTATTPDIAEQVRKITDGGIGVHIVIDHVGAATWATSIAALRPGGRMAVCGMTSGNEATVPVRMFYTKQITMTGALLGTKSQLLELINFVIRKKIQPVIDSIFPLEGAPEAQRKMEEGRQAGKILLKCK